ncbi:MAG TPA: recombinase family protein [Pirellulales bacterium]|jgi:DNA invertase Pin-like site-specific DNA recombinase|nr:recombinase family protein [Pirellulales bacterium]
MPRINLDPPLVAKDGTTLKVVAIDRISTKNQDPKANADQRALLHRWVEDRYDGTVEWTYITGQGSGECIDRQQVRDAEDAVAAGDKDLAIMEDLGRHLRRAQAIDFCEQCEDGDTRLVAINDGIDTFKDWRLHAFFAAIKHEQSNKDTSERIKRSLRNRFLQGEVVQFTIAGYIKPKGAKTDAELQKDPAAEPVYDKWFEMLESGATYSDVADWLNQLGFKTGDYCDNDKWDCAMVARVTHNPILKGVRQRNKRKAKRVNRSGKRISVKARPEEILERLCPHLTFIEPDRYDRVIRRLRERNAIYKPGGDDGPDPRAGRAKKRTIWPGQHIYCGICGRLLRYGGHGQNDHLLCRGAYEYRCWNGVTVDGPLAGGKISAAILAEIESLPDFDQVFYDIVRQELAESNASRSKRLAEVCQQLDKVEREIGHVIRFVREGRRMESLHEELENLEGRRGALLVQKKAIEEEPIEDRFVPSIALLKQLARQQMALHAAEPYEFGRIMHELIKKIVVFPYRLCDGGPVVLRAKFRLRLAPLLPPAQRLAALESKLSHVLTVDLFDPPQREKYRQRVMAMKAGKNTEDGRRVTERTIAAQLGITQTAVQRAVALARMMDRLALTDPYVPVTSPPQDCTKMRRHKHRRYRFEPLPDAGSF